ncbi:MAG: hypothetical protein LBE12_19830 [Planctomycetaceae bacterium]|nr:hypothetical protein [Planctomycetaceae bacterium]
MKRNYSLIGATNIDHIRHLNGKTPNEVYYHRHAANAKPRIETRPKVKHSTPFAKPRICLADKAGTKIKLRFEFLEGRLYLPIIRVEQI